MSGGIEPEDSRLWRQFDRPDRFDGNSDMLNAWSDGRFEIFNLRPGRIELYELTDPVGSILDPYEGMPDAHFVCASSSLFLGVRGRREGDADSVIVMLYQSICG